MKKNEEVGSVWITRREYQLLWEKWIATRNLGGYKCPNSTFAMEKNT